VLKVLLGYRCSEEGRSNLFERVLPVGLGYVHAYLRSRGALAVLANFSLMGRSRIREILRAERPDIVGLSTFTFNRRATLDLATLVRRTLPEAKIVLGGPHATHVGAPILAAHPEIDACVIGEGEITLERYASTLAEGSDPGAVPGLLLRGAGGEIRSTGPAEPIADLDALPFPALYPEGYAVDPLAQYPYVVTSRGCPAKCTFCSSPEFWGTGVRFRSARNILDELEHLKARFGLLYVSFRDDIFTLNKTRVIDLCRGMIDRRLGLLWDCQTRVNTIDEERLVWMKRAGAMILQYGIESGSQPILDRLGKGQTLAQIERAAALTRKVGLVLSVYLIAGVPGETEREVGETEEMIRRIRPHDGIVTPLAVFPGTSLWDEYRSRAGTDEGFWEEVGRDGVFVRPERFTEDAILRLSAALEQAAVESSYRREDYARHREVTGGCAVTDLMEGEALECAGDPAGAEALYLDLARREPWNAWPRLRLGRLAQASDRPAEAEEHFRAACEIVPASVEAGRLRAKALRALGRVSEAGAIEAAIGPARPPAPKPRRGAASARGFQSYPLTPSPEGRDAPG